MTLSSNDTNNEESRYTNLKYAAKTCKGCRVLMTGVVAVVINDIFSDKTCPLKISRSTLSSDYSKASSESW